MALEVTLLIISVTIITYILAGAKAIYEKRDMLDDVFIIGYTWQIFATAICYWVFYPKVVWQTEAEFAMEMIMKSLLIIAILTFVGYWHRHWQQIPMIKIAKSFFFITIINMVLLIPTVFFEMPFEYLLIPISTIFMIIEIVLFRRKDKRQHFLPFTQMTVACIVFLVSAMMRSTGDTLYLVGISNAALFLYLFGIVFYYVEFTSLKLKDSQETVLKESLKYKHLSERYTLAMQAVQEGIWEYDFSTDQFQISEGLAKTFGLSGTLIDNAYEVWRKMIHPEDRGRFSADALSDKESLKRSIAQIEERSLEREYRLALSTGEYNWVRHKISFERDSSGSVKRLFGVFSVIQEVKEAEEKIYQYAYLDSLTGLKNFTSLKKDIHKLVSFSKEEPSNCVMVVDIDRFKFINDTRGHQFGDEILKAVGQRLMEFSDEVYRVGGNEFVLVQSKGIIQCDVYNRLNEVYIYGDSELYISISIGLLSGAELRACATVEDVLTRLDLAKSRAKDLGGNCVISFDVELFEGLSEKMTISDALRPAINNEDLFMVFQPQMCLRSGNIIGFEALLRWHLNGRAIPPDKVVEVAEETGQMAHLGRFIIEQVFKQFKYLKPEQKVSINLSILQLEETNFIKEVEILRNKYSVESSRVYFEITESVWIRSQQEKIRVLHELRNLGYKISLDDFGTGYSSYSYIEELPLDELKLDMSFTKKMMKSRKHQQMTVNIIQLGKIFDLNVVCEGIETKEELNFLSLNGCDVGQGYLISKPVRLETD